jgi:hypothetical protein
MQTEREQTKAGWGTKADAALRPLPQAGEGWGKGAGNNTASKTIAPSASSESERAKNYSKSAANDAESRYWASLNETARQKRKRCKSRTGVPEQKGLRQMHAKPSYARSTTSTPTR